MLDEIKKAVQHDCTHNDGIMLSVTFVELIWLMQQAEKVEWLETVIKNQDGELKWQSELLLKEKNKKSQYKEAIRSVAYVEPQGEEDEEMVLNSIKSFLLGVLEGDF